jgi:predicted unusual protein kinase regulating ubiquinone biosynthesis (AarF/ABC1/UbiB family)
VGTDWEKLAGETGETVPSGRLDRMFRVGKLGASVGASAAMHKLGSAFGFGKGKRDEGPDPYLVKQGEKIAAALGQMKGAAMKVGQMLSSDPDLLPPEIMARLGSLQSQAPPMTWRTVKQVLETALDRPIESVFSYFDPEPIGAASIGQVHRGRLATGESVAVKIQYPGIARTLDSDIKNFGSVMAMSRVVIEKKRIDDYLEEVRRAIEAESDYLAEARNLSHFHEVLSERPGVTCPRPFLEWTRPNVLVMELIQGRKLDEALLAMTDAAAKTELLERFVSMYSWMLHERGELHADPHPGNFLVTEGGGLVVLDFGCVKTCEETFANGILDIMDCCWQGDDQRAADTYKRLGFGKDSHGSEVFDAARLREYHEIGLEPFLRDEEFHFADWDMRRRLQRFILDWPTFLKMTPPAEGLLIFRVLGGIKGLLTKVDGRLNVHRMAVETARRSGRLTGEPLRSALLSRS